MKQKTNSPSVVEELCRKLKIQLDELAVKADGARDTKAELEAEARRTKLMEQLKRQLAELSL